MSDQNLHCKKHSNTKPVI